MASVATMRSRSGSSPRLRGTQLPPDLRCRRPGIIPALAGNTSRYIHACCAMRDHPRACGEHRATRKAAAFGSGSSPRLRGTQCVEYNRLCYQGIIPALAGNTSRTLYRAQAARDHPRACGEHTTWYRDFPLFAGSSPRLRGTPAFAPVCVDELGIIPALAGNTR